MPSSCAMCGKADAASVCGGCKCTYYCGTDCQRKDWKRGHKKQCKTLRSKTETVVTKAKTKAKGDVKSKPKTVLFRVEKVEGKGMGMIANEDISMGTMILNENPLLSLTSDSALDIRAIDVKQFKKLYAEPLLQRFKALTSTEQQVINSLSFKHDGSVLDIFLNNCLTHQDNGFDGVYPNIARINHSCNANCVHWIENNFNARIIALRKIEKGEEITIDYNGWNLFDYKERTKRLLDGWKIAKCSCEWCDKKRYKQMDKWIGEYKQLDETIPKIKDLNRKYEACKAIVKLIGDRFNSNAQLLYRHCWDLAQSALSVRNRDEFVTNLVNTVKYKRLAHGKDTKVPEEVSEMIKLMPPDIQKDIRSKIKKKRTEDQTSKNQTLRNIGFAGFGLKGGGGG
eukprot:46761_1